MYSTGLSSNLPSTSKQTNLGSLGFVRSQMNTLGKKIVRHKAWILPLSPGNWKLSEAR